KDRVCNNIQSMAFSPELLKGSNPLLRCLRDPPLTVICWEDHRRHTVLFKDTHDLPVVSMVKAEDHVSTAFCRDFNFRGVEAVNADRCVACSRTCSFNYLRDHV